jgi:hypothetical protein
MRRASVLRRLRCQTAALLCAVTCLLVARQSVAQAPTSQDVDRAQLLRAQTQPLPVGPTVEVNGEAGRAVSSPNDADLGEQEILKQIERYQAFMASVSVPFYYTSNVALTRRGEVSDFVTAPAAGIFYQPRITRTLYGLFAVRQQFFYYNEFNSFDFGSFDAEAGLNYFLPQFHNLILRAEYDFNRLTSSDRVLDDFFSNHQLIASVELPIRFGRAQQLSLGAGTNISIAADHESPRRNDYGVFAGYSVRLTRSFVIDAVGRVVVRDYYHGDRTDVSEILALSAIYQLTNWWTVSVISSFAASQSNHSVFDYNVANVGGAIALTAKF